MPFLEHEGNTREVTRGETLIGSGSQAAWRLQNVDLAARHFTLHSDTDGATRLKPSSAHNIVVVNGRQVGLDGTKLEHGDVIDAGSARIYFLEDLKRTRNATLDQAGSPAFLVDHKERRAFPLARRSTSLGRDSASQVLLKDPSVSRFHADVRGEAGNFVLYSMGSAGTRVNGHNVAGPRLLEEGDKIEVGSSTLVFTRKEIPAGVQVIRGGDAGDEKLSRRSTQLYQKAVSDTGEQDVIGQRKFPVIPIAIAVVVVILVLVFVVF